MRDVRQLRPRSRRLLAGAAVAAVVALAAGGCGGDDDAASRPPDGATSTATTSTMDDAGRAQRVPASSRIDAGGDTDLKPMVLAATDTIEARYPEQHVTWESSAYGRELWGVCLGSSEAAALRDRAGWGWGYEQCEKTGIRIISLPLAQGVWLAVGSRASMRPEVAAYVDATLAQAGTSAAQAGVEPLSAAALASSRSHYRQFVAAERAKGTEPLVG